MPAHRFFLDDGFHHSTLVLSGPELHHLKHVMRVRQHEQVELINGRGTLATAKILEMKPTEALCEITQKFQAPPSSDLILAQALTRPALLDWIIEKGTELGATQFWLFPGDLSEKKELTPHQIERLHHLMIGGIKQCGRLYLPTLEIKPALSSWKKPSETFLFGSLSKASQPLKDSYPSPVIIAIGPEKGFSLEEHSILENQLQAQGVKLHSNVLRAETAALCALSLLSYKQLSLSDPKSQPGHL